MSRVVATLLTLHWRQWLALPFAAVGLLLCRRTLRSQPFADTWKLLQMPDTQLQPEPIMANIRVAEQLHESVRLAARLLPCDIDCLPRSIVLRRLLLQRNIAATVRLGVSRQSDLAAGDSVQSTPSLYSHAWVEVGGQPIAEKNDVTDRFRVVSLPVVSDYSE